MKTLMRAIIAAAAIAVATPAIAIDFATPIKQLDGEPMRKEDKQLFTLNDAVQTALLSSYQDEQMLDGIEKAKRFRLAQKINEKRKDPELTADDVALIKRLVAKAYNPLVVGRVWELLDPASVPK